MVGGIKNSEGRRVWWGAPGRMLQDVLEHLEGGNDPPLAYPTAVAAPVLSTTDRKTLTQTLEPIALQSPQSALRVLRPRWTHTAGIYFYFVLTCFSHY